MLCFSSSMYMRAINWVLYFEVNKNRAMVIVLWDWILYDNTSQSTSNLACFNVEISFGTNILHHSVLLTFVTSSLVRLKKIWMLSVGWNDWSLPRPSTYQIWLIFIDILALLLSSPQVFIILIWLQVPRRPWLLITTSP